MKKIFKLENLDCAHCAEKMEAAINKLNGVTAKINFFTLRLTIDAADETFDEVVDNAQKIISGIEHDCKIIRG